MSLRLPASLLDLPPPTRPPLVVSLFVGGLFYPVTPDGLTPADAEWEDVTLVTARSVHTTPSGGRWVSGSGQATEVRTTLTLHLEGSPAECGRRADRWTALVGQMTRLYIGARYWTVLRAGDRQPAVGRGLNSRSVKWVIDLQDEYLRLSPDDMRPRRYPTEADAGLYPLGLLRVVGFAPRVYEVEYLGGISGTPVTYTAPYTGLVFHPLELTYDPDH
jgi:hypothetical protein